MRIKVCQNDREGKKKNPIDSSLYDFFCVTWSSALWDLETKFCMLPAKVLYSLVITTIYIYDGKFVISKYTKLILYLLRPKTPHFRMTRFLWKVRHLPKHCQWIWCRSSALEVPLLLSNIGPPFPIYPIWDCITSWIICDHIISYHFESYHFWSPIHSFGWKLVQANA